MLGVLGGVTFLYCAALVAGLFALGAIPIILMHALSRLGIDVGHPPPLKHAAGYGFVIALAIGFAWAIFTNPVGFFLGGGGRGDPNPGCDAYVEDC